jgi:hypothetical protein
MNDRRHWLVLSLATLVFCTTALRAEDAPPAAEKPAAPKVDLSQSQLQVLRDFERFEKSLYDVAEVSRRTDPERAELLYRARSQSQEQRLLTDMQALADMLKPKGDGKVVIGDAPERQDELIARMENLLKVLQSADQRDRLRNRMEEIEDLIKDTNRIIGKQRDVRAETGRNTDPSQLEGREREVADDAEKLAEKIDKQDAERRGESPDSKNSKSPGKSNNGKPQPGKEGESPEKNGEPKDGDEKPSDGDSKPNDAGDKPKDGDPKSPDKPDADKPGDKTDPSKKPGDKNVDEKKPSDQPGDESKKPADPKGNGSKSPSESGDQPMEGDKPMDGGKSPMNPDGQPSPKSPKSKPKAGGRQEPQQGGQPQPPRELGQPQDSGDDQPQPNQAENGEKKPERTAGRDDLEAARKTMQKAIEELQKQNREGAGEAEQKALAQLEQMKARLEAILRQLRDQEKELMLASIESRLQKIRKAQMQVNAETVRLEKIPSAERGDRHLDRSVSLGRDERDVVLDAEKTLQLLKEEGSSVAFPEAVEQMRDNMVTVADRLNRGDTAQTTQVIEELIVETLDEMILSLQQEMDRQKDKDKQKPPKGQPQQQQEEGLVQKIAELKMIRSLQNQINRLTREIGRELDGEQATDPDKLKLTDDLARRQKRLQKATYDLSVGKNK